MALTLDDLAALSGVSRATISRVINGGPVSEATRTRVLEVLERTGYRPTLAARTLASGRSGVVGVVMHVEPRLLFEDPYFSQLLQGMSDVLADQATGMMLWLGNRSKEDTLENILRVGLLDGVIVTAHWLDDPLVDGLLAAPLPTVLIGHRRHDRSASWVDVDNLTAADTLTTHLIDIGRRRIGHITGLAGSVAGEDRRTGYLQAMARAGLPTDDLVVPGDFTTPAGREGATVLLDRGVDAIFCGNDSAAVGALEAITARGLRVPDDVALAGFDDLAFAAHTDPPLTTVRQQVARQGAEAANALFALLADPGAEPRRLVVPTELVVRASTIGAARGADPVPERVGG